MRTAALLVALVIATPVFAEECAYESQSGQQIDWRGGDTLTFDPLYTDAATCQLLAKPDNPNWYTADCSGFTADVVIGASTVTAPLSDIVVWDGVFFWFKCVKDRA